MNKTSVLLICGSKKPAKGKNTPSAARELLKVVDQGIKKSGGKTTWIDLRNITLPFFDGRSIEEYSSKDLQIVVEQIKSASILIISIPAYWGGASGVIKNLFDLLGGPKYRSPEEIVLPLEKKLIGLLIVGDDDISASIACMHMRQVFTMLGAYVLPRDIVVGNPQKIKEVTSLFRQLEEFGDYIWKTRKILPQLQKI